MSLSEESVEKLAAARDAALACVCKSKELWHAVIRIPDIDPELAPSLDAADLALEEERITQKYLHVVAAVGRFDDTPDDILKLVDEAAARDVGNPQGQNAHREARNLAEEFTGDKIPLSVSSSVATEHWDKALTLATWRRMRSVVTNDANALRYWRHLEDRIRREHQLALHMSERRTDASEEEAAIVAMMDKLRRAIHELGKDASSAAILNKAGGNRQRALKALRRLQELGEYHGYVHKPRNKGHR